MPGFNPQKWLLPTALLFAVSLTLSVYAHRRRAEHQAPAEPRASALTAPGGEQAPIPSYTGEGFTLLILGLDTEAQLTDVIMLARLDNLAHKAVLLQLPRDLYVGEAGGVTGKLNAVYAYKGSLERGVAALRQVLSRQMGLVADYYLLIDLQTLRQGVDDLGGVEVDLPEAVTFAPGKTLPAGPQRLNGQQAEWLVRARVGYMDGDLGRMRAQLMFLSAALNTAKDKDMATLLPLAAKYYPRLHTDLPLSTALSLLPVVTSLTEADITPLTAPLGRFAMQGEYAVFVAHNPGLAKLLEQHFDVPPGSVALPAPEAPPPEAELDPILIEDLFEPPKWPDY